MSNINKQALREAAEKAGADEWRAFIDTKSKTYAVHTLGDNRCGNVVKWAGFDGQTRAAAKAKFIAEANPATVLALLDEMEAAEKRIAGLESDIKSANERYENRAPTEWAYNQACAAIEKHRLRADNAEAQLAELVAAGIITKVGD